MDPLQFKPIIEVNTNEEYLLISRKEYDDLIDQLEYWQDSYTGLSVLIKNGPSTPAEEVYERIERERKQQKQHV